MYPREVKIYNHTKTYTQMLTAGLFITVPNWKEPKSPSTGEWINNYPSKRIPLINKRK